MKEIDPCEQLDDEVEDLLLQMVDEFVTSTVSSACIFAKHRNASSVETKDVQLYLGKWFHLYRSVRSVPCESFAIVHFF